MLTRLTNTGFDMSDLPPMITQDAAQAAHFANPDATGPLPFDMARNDDNNSSTNEQVANTLIVLHNNLGQAFDRIAALEAKVGT